MNNEYAVSNGSVYILIVLSICYFFYLVSNCNGNNFEKSF